jgi:uncharacterized protein YbaA (DUF1428 family)
MFNFKKWFYFTEAIDQNTEKALLQQKVDANQLNDFINQLKNQPEPIDTRSAFAKLQEKFPILKKDKIFPEAPTDPFFKEYYDLLTKREITKPEYYTLLFFSKENRELLTSMMQSLRNLIQERKIELNFINNIPTIVYQKKAIPNKDFTQFNAMLHGIEGQNTKKPSNNNLADPFFLEVSDKEKLVAKSADGTIWVFKATGPLDCRLMGKGQSWCISSSSSAQWYFNYRHEHGQTQYFIFDFNKDEKDPARYVNPGVAPEDDDSEWVDTSNSPDDINGYSSIEEYKDYLKSKGIDVGVFVADPLTEEEELLKKSSENYNWGSSSEKDKIFQEFKEGEYKELFDKFMETMSFLDVGLMEKHFITLSEQQKKLYLSNIGDKGFKNLLKRSSKPDELIDQILPYVKDKLDGGMLEALLEYSSNRDELRKRILALVKDKLDSKMVIDLLRNSSNKDELINQIFPYVKDKLDSYMVDSLLRYSSRQNRDELINQIFPLVKDKLDSDMVRHVLQYSSKIEDHFNQLSDQQRNFYLSNIGVDELRNLLKHSSRKNRDELINQIIPLVKDKLDRSMVEALLEYSSKSKEPINQILALVKDKLDRSMVEALLNDSSKQNREELINQILPLVKNKLDSNMVHLLLYASSNKDELINQILRLVKYDLGFTDIVRDLLYHSSDKDELINQIFPYVKDKLDSKMVSILFKYSSEPDEMINQIFPYVKDKLDSEIVYSLLYYSSKQNRDEILNQILPLVKDKLDSDMVDALLDYSSNPDEMRKRIDAMKNSV